MPFEKIAFIQIEKFNKNNFQIVKCISQRLGSTLYVFLLNIDGNTIVEVEKELKDENIIYHLKSFDDIKSLKSHISKENPDIVILTEEKINPLKHIFTHTPAEKLLKHVENFNIILLQEHEDNIQKALIYVTSKSTDFYIKNSYEFIKKIIGKVTFVYSFYEDAYQVSIKKTHTEEEAEEILEAMFDEKKKDIDNKIKKVLKEEDYRLITILGEPKKDLNLFAKNKGYNFVIISSKVEDKNSFIENLQISLGIFLDKEEE